MIGSDLLRPIREAINLAGHATIEAAADLASLLDSISLGIRGLSALPGRENAPLRDIGARMDGLLLSIHKPDVIRSRPLLLTRLHMLAQEARLVDAIEEERAEAVAAAVVSSKVVRFPGPLYRSLHRAQVRA